MRFMKIHEIEVHISDFRRIFKNSDKSTDFIDLSPWDLKNTKYVFMVQVPYVFQDGAPDYQLEFRQLNCYKGFSCEFYFRGVCLWIGTIELTF